MGDGLRFLGAMHAGDLLGGTKKKKQPFGCFFFLVPPRGIEPRFWDPQSHVLSVERRGESSPPVCGYEHTNIEALLGQSVNLLKFLC